MGGQASREEAGAGGCRGRGGTLDKEPSDGSRRDRSGSRPERIRGGDRPAGEGFTDGAVLRPGAGAVACAGDPPLYLVGG